MEVSATPRANRRRRFQVRRPGTSGNYQLESRTLAVTGRDSKALGAAGGRGNEEERRGNMHEPRSQGGDTGDEEALPQSLRLYSIRQVARILQVTPVVRKLIFTGKLPATRVGILLRVQERSIEAFLEASPCTEPDPRRASRGGKQRGR
jgi:excisionase family DNA binding protein